MTDVDPVAWSETVEVEYDNTDTISLRNIDVIVRFDRSFGYDMLAVAVQTVSPEGLSLRDTVRIAFPQKDIETRVFVESRQPYRSGASFPAGGRYRFRFSPVMPEPEPRGVTAIGLKIE